MTPQEQTLRTQDEADRNLAIGRCRRMGVVTDLTVEEYAEQRWADAENNVAETGDDSYGAARYRGESRAYRDILAFLKGQYRPEYLEAVRDRMERRSHMARSDGS